MTHTQTSLLHRVLRSRKFYVFLVSSAVVLTTIFNVKPHSIYIILGVALAAAISTYVVLSVILIRKWSIPLTLLLWGGTFLHMAGILDGVNMAILVALSVVLFIYFSR